MVKSLTKAQMARVIVHALHNMSHTPPENNVNVVRMAKRNTKEHLTYLYKRAVSILKDKGIIVDEDKLKTNFYAV